MQTFSSDRKRVLRILLTLHQVPVKKKKKKQEWPRKKTDILLIISVKKKENAINNYRMQHSETLQSTD